MDELKLPEQLKGPWHHALILTYGMDIPFFESALLSQFGARCRNKMILADGRQYLEASANYAQSGLVRYMNQRYVAEGVFSPRAAHAKLILLAHPERGRLLVGSGNLGLQGYASPGELFTQYEYAPEQMETLSAFLSGVDLIKGLIAKGYVSETVSRHIDRLLEGTPWLYQSNNSEWQPVRHNLERPFLNQLVEAANNEPVEELWVLSPFYDASTFALAETLARLQPQQTNLLVQPGSTSVDPKMLAKVIAEAQTPCSVRAFQHLEEKNLYYHAKLYLLKFKDHAICLQGSPNLSQVAMLRTADNGNIELANLLTGSRDSFDYLFESLMIEPETLELGTLDLSFQSNDDSSPSQPTWQLRGGVWQDDKLVLDFQGILPDLSEAKLDIAGYTFPSTIIDITSSRITLKIPAEAMDHFKHTSPIQFQWDNGDEFITANPVFVCNRARLTTVLEAEESDEKIDRAGGLDLDDEELEQLVGELEAHMVFDRQSVWQVAGKKLPKTHTENDDALHLDYADIDYEMLRQHPKIRQYTAFGQSSTGYARTRLQIILSSITDHFQSLIDVASGDNTSTTMTIIDTIEAADTEEDIEQEEEEKQRHQRSQEQRLRHIFKNFIRRYLRGISSPDFQELAGHQVITHNYIIFSNLLWALFNKEWFDSESQFVIESLLKTWQFFWGTHDKSGYYQQQEKDIRAEMFQLVQDYHADALLLTSLYHCARLSYKENVIRLSLRNFWRYLLEELPFSVDSRVMEDAWIYVADNKDYRVEPPPPSRIVQELDRLARFETEANFLRSIETKCNRPVGSCYFDRVTAQRFINYRNVEDTVKCLFVSDKNNTLPQETAVSLVQSWMVYETLDHYRISFMTTESTKKVLFYETVDSKGVFWDEALGVDTSIRHLSPLPFSWSNELAEIEIIAKKLDSTITIPQSFISAYSNIG